MIQTAHRFNRSGLTLIELIIGISILSFSLVALYFAIGRGSIANQEARLQDIAGRTLHKQIEILRTESLNWPAVTAPGGLLAIGVPHGFTFGLPAELPSASGSYTSSFTGFAPGDSSILEVELTLTYLYQGSTRTASVTTYIYERGLNQR